MRSLCGAAAVAERNQLSSQGQGMSEEGGSGQNLREELLEASRHDRVMFGKVLGDQFVLSSHFHLEIPFIACRAEGWVIAAISAATSPMRSPSAEGMISQAAQA